MKTMKKTMILTAVLFVSTFFMSCSSDDDAPQDTIIGKW
jgi:PBP1b-binding outer membrane lipoprotein LpoB